MARQIIVLALIFFAILGAVSAKDTAPASAPADDVAEEAEGAPSTGVKGEPIGELSADAPTEEMGPAAAEAMGPTRDEKSSAGALKVSAAVVAVAGFFSF